MQTNKHGIPIATSMPKMQKYKTFKPHPEYYKYKKYATLVGYENGCVVTAICPVAHPDFKKLKTQGYRVIEDWERRDVYV